MATFWLKTGYNDRKPLSQKSRFPDQFTLKSKKNGQWLWAIITCLLIMINK